MSQKINRIAFGVGCLALGALVGALAIGAGPEKKEAPKGGAPDEAAMMEAMMKLATPGAAHKHLEQWAGDWNLVVKSWMAPDAPVEESKATASSKLIMGGRYLVEKVNGSWDMGGQIMEFEGMAIMGFDNQKQQFFSLWFDNFGTGLMEQWGTGTPDGKSITTAGRTFNPMVGSEVDVKSITRVIDAKTRSMEMWMPGPDGKMFKHMEIAYTRK